MYRLFQTHHIRRSISLPDFWTLNVPNHNAIKIPVPSCVESVPAFSHYKGKCIIATKQRFAGDALLVFKGVGHSAKVFVDGDPIGSHYGAYGKFSFLLRNMEDTVHSICVEADNSLTPDSALHIDNDYYSYLGITRPVILNNLNHAYIKWIHITPEHIGTAYDDGLWRLNIAVSVQNILDTDFNMDLKLYLSSSDENVINSHCVVAEQKVPISLSAGETKTFSCSINCENVSMYMPENPAMYYMHAQLNESGTEDAFDDLIERFGFREVKVCGKDILFNGVPMKIKGFNRHEEYAEFGSSVPLAAMHRDIQLLKDLGANCVRTCHYPNDERFLDLCDENGLLVWEEAHARGLTLAQMENPNFMEQSRLTATEMITQHYNHPAIYVWGLLNECASDTEYGRICYSTLISLIRSLDTSRPITFASCKTFHDLCLDLVDIVSYNIYPKWYHDTDVATYIDSCITYIRANGGNNKPVIISEIGAGGIYGYRTNTCVKWSEDYQAEALEAQITGVLEHEACAGVIVWQFCDCRVEDGWALKRPKTQNNKGIVDIYRREKLGYYKVKELFHKY